MSSSIADILRRKRRATTPGFAGGSLEEQVLNEREPEMLTPGNQQAITRPRRTYNTTLSPDDEQKFAEWKQRNAPDDSGSDYDLRGAYKAGVSPTTNGHWPDTFKKPNHPTFSNESRYATGANAARAGRWNNDTFVPPADDTTRPRAVTFDPQTGRPNEDYYRNRSDTAGLYGAYRDWNPRGGKRGFKNSLKAALMMSAEGARTNPDDPVTGALAGLAIGGAAGTAVPNFTNRLRRYQKLGQFGGELKQDLELKKQQAAIDQSQMIEVELDNGQRVMVPAKSAATLQSRQQEIGLRGDTLTARKKRWEQLGEHEAARDAQALYNSGAADDSAELRAEIARRLRLPAGTVLPPRGLGNQIKLDDAGNYVVISPRKVGPTGVESYETTKEAGRDTRQRRALEASAARTQIQQAGADRRAGMRAGGTGQARVDAPTRREIARGVGALETVKGELAQLDAQISALDAAAKGRERTPEELARITALGRQRQEKVNQAKAISAQLDALDPNNETGVGEGGYPYRKPRNVASSDNVAPTRTIEGAIDAFTRKVGRAPTAEEIAKMKAALGQ